MPAELLAQYWGVVLAGIVVLALAAWTYQERQETASAKETTQRVGDRAQNAVGGLVGVLVATLFAIAGTILQTGMELGDLAVALADFVGANPELASAIGIGGLGALGLEGVLPISTAQFLGIAVTLLGIGIVIAMRDSEQGA